MKQKMHNLEFNMKNTMENGMKLLNICLEEMFHNVVKDGEDFNLLKL